MKKRTKTIFIIRIQGTGLWMFIIARNTTCRAFRVAKLFRDHRSLNLASYALQAPENDRLYPGRIKPLHAHMPFGIHEDGSRRIPGQRHTAGRTVYSAAPRGFRDKDHTSLVPPNNDLDAELSKEKTPDLAKAVAAIRVGKRIQPVLFTAPFHHKGCERGGFSSRFLDSRFRGNDGCGGNGRSRG